MNTDIEYDQIDNKFVYIDKIIKYTLNITLMFLFTSWIINSSDTITQNQTILIICTISTILFYILDLNFPSCKL